MLRLIGFTTLALAASVTVAGAEEAVIKPAAERFTAEALKAAAVAEVPDFQRHVVPLLGKQGCNSRACHGSFQGQGGLRLSLFGYDFNMDHNALKDRIDTDKAEDSYVLQKATLTEPHKGGKRLDLDSWQYNVLREWVRGGAKNVDLDARPRLSQLHVTPAEVRFDQNGQAVDLRVVAEWANGEREDVTCLCRFQTNDEQVADVDASGRVTSHQAGDTNIVVFYDKGVLPIPVVRPVSDQTGDRFPAVVASTKIDELVVDKLRKLGVVPSAVAGDTEFLRRVSLDITGTLPSPQEIREFAADTRSSKRALKIDELLARPTYSAWWATRFSDWTGNSDDQVANNNAIPQGQISQGWYDWIRVRLERNEPYDNIVEGIVLASSRENGESYREFCENLSRVYWKDRPEGDPQFSDRETLPHFWARTNFRQPDERVIAFSYTFLGIRMQCAQCHKHPFDQWTQDDFHLFKNLFAATRYGQGSRDEYNKMIEELGIDPKGKNGNQIQNELRRMVVEGKVVPFQELTTPRVARPRSQPPVRRKGKDGKPEEVTPMPEPGPGKAIVIRRDENGSPTFAPHQAQLLGGDKLVDLSDYEDPRTPLMDWLRSNPLFARALVNRVWANYFNVGIVNPTDDMSRANPPSNAPLLDYLTGQFIARKYDIKWLHREICNSDTYQRTWVPTESNRLDERNFSHSIPRRLPAEVAVDAIVMATVNDTEFTRLQTELSLPAGVPGDRVRNIALANAGARANANGNRFALSAFGRSIRESNCDCDRSSETSLLQTVFLQNDGQVYTMIDQRNSGWVAQLDRELNPPKAPERDEDRKVTALRRKVEQAEKQLESLRDGGKSEKNEKQIERVKEILDKARRELAEAAPPKKPDEPKPAASPDVVARIVTDAYLRTLSREPSEEERSRSVEYVTAAETPLKGTRDLLWALINTKEFIVNH